MSSRLPTPYYVLFYFGLFLIRWALNLKFNSRFHLKTVIRWNYVLPLGPAVYSQFSECCWMKMTLLVVWNVIKVKKTEMHFNGNVGTERIHNNPIYSYSLLCCFLEWWREQRKIGEFGRFLFRFSDVESTGETCCNNILKPAGAA